MVTMTISSYKLSEEEMNSNVLPSVSETDVPGDHQVTLNVNIIQAVESSDKNISFRESVRDGEVKRIYESPVANHHFHLEYRLLPGKNAQVFKTDVATFGNVVAKIYTDRDNRMVQCWSEEEGANKLSYYGWRHKHTFKILNKEQLLKIYDHVLELRVWNTASKFSARAKYDRPKAFRIPVPQNTTTDIGSEGEGKDMSGISKRPSKFSVVYHDQVRRMSRMSKAKNIRPISSKLGSHPQPQTMVPVDSTVMPNDDSNGSIEQDSSRRSFIPLIQEEGEGVSSSGINRRASVVLSNQLVPPSSSVTQSFSQESATSQESNKQEQVISHRKQKRLEAEAAEEARIEREGIAVLRVNLLDLFSKYGTAHNKLSSPVKNLKHLEVNISVADSLLTEQLSRELNPMMITVIKATGLPSSPLCYNQLQQRCEPSFVRYQFHTKAPHCTRGVPQSSETVWNDTHTLLLGTIDHQLLIEYLRGPHLVMELHDRSRRPEDKTLPVLFGGEMRDDVLGTHAFTAGLSHSSPSTALHGDKPWSPYGVARLDLSGLLQGQRMLELTVPVTNGPRCPSEHHEAVLTDPIAPGDYIGSQCQLKVLVEVSHPLNLNPVANETPITSSPSKISSSQTPEHENKATPEHKLSSKGTPEHSLPKRSGKFNLSKQSRKSTHELPRRDSKIIPEQTTKAPPDTCPFNRAIYIISSKGKSLAYSLIASVNEINARALSLDDLPADVLPTALSTYKLTKEQMTSADCDVITGFHVEDWEQHVIVLEGLKKGGLKKIWEELPHHNTDDESINKVLYNSEFEFSQRQYALLDVDLPNIRLYRPLSEITQQPLLYVRDSITDKCFRALMVLNELSLASEMSDVTRNCLFPTSEEVTSLSLQFALPPSVNLTDHDDETAVQAPSVSRSLQHHPRKWKPLEMTNPQFVQHLNERQDLPPADFIAVNKFRVQALSEVSSSRKSCHPNRQRSLSETTPVHNYSTQTYNSIQLAKARLRERLASDPDHRYTHCQHYHSMTVVPVDIDAERKAEKLEDHRKWRTNKGFVYPGVPSARSSNSHPKAPHFSRVESLKEPFVDNKLHANTLKPTVERTQFSSKNRTDDFERWRQPPSYFGPPLPITIHLAGESRAKELQEVLDQEHSDWTDRLVVSNPYFKLHRCSIQTELTESGPKASTQLDKLSGLLKDSPQKHSLKQASGLTVHDMPALNVVNNPRLVNPNIDDTGDNGSKRGYVPGPDASSSLKLNTNIIPLTHDSSKGALQHPQDFRLYYHIPKIPAGVVAKSD